MAGKNIKCVPASQASGFAELVKLYNGNEAAATDAWVKNGYEIPAEALANVAEDIVKNEFTMDEDVEVNATLLKEAEIIKKVKAILTSKIKGLSKVIETHPGLETGRDEMQEILDDADVVSAQETLIGFIQAADKVTKKAKKWLADYENGNKTPSFDRIKRIEDYVTSFSVLDELSRDMFDGDENLAIFDSVAEIKKIYTEVRNGYITLARKLIVEHVSGDFHKVTALYKKNAEALFNKTYRKHYDKSEVDQARIDFVNKQMIANANEIKINTQHYVHNMLLATTDIDTLSAWVVNPKDLNNDLVSIALQAIDEADLSIWNTMEEIGDESDRLNTNFINYIGKQGSTKDQYSIFLAKDENGEATTTIVNPEHPDFKEFREKYAGVPAVWELYEHISRMVKEKDRMVYAKGRLKFELPRIEQDNYERAYNNGLLATIKSGVGDKFKLRGKDVELGLISEEDLENDPTTEALEREERTIEQSGKEREVVPLHYRNTKIDPKDQSFDVVGALTLDYYNCLKFKTKLETGTFLEVLKDVVHETYKNETTSFTRDLITNKEAQVQHSTKGGLQIERVIDDLIKHRIYGITVDGDAKIAKIAKSVGTYTSFLTMSANVTSGVVNLLHGTAVGWIETAGGKYGYYTAKDRLKAAKEYDLNLAGIINDAGERVPKSKINLLARRFNAFSESHILNGKSYAQNNKLKRLGDSSAIMAANGVGEHALQSITMLSVLNNIKVKDVNGNFLTRDFKPTTDRSEAIGLNDAYQLNEDGKLELNNIVHSTERTNGVGHKDMTIISNMIKRVSRDIYGNYAGDNKARFQRYATMALMGQMRGWLVTGYQKRWRGAGTSGLFRKGDNFMKVGDEFSLDRLHKLSYNADMDTFEEGQYITSARFLRTMAQEIKAMGVVAGTAEAWGAMNGEQKGRFRKTLLEAGMIAGAFLLAGTFDDDKDDPNDIENIYLAYTARRMYSELFSFANPQESLRTFRSPAIALSSVENAFKVVGQLMSPGELYEGGRHTGENKLWRKTQKLIPVLKQFTTDIEDKYAFLKSN